MVFYNDQLLALQDNGGNGPITCHVVNPSDGTVESEPLFTIIIDTYNLIQSNSLVVHNGDLYAVVYGDNVNYNGLFLVEISINETTDFTMIAQLPDYNRILGSIYINEEPLLVIQQDDSDFSGLYYYDLNNQQLGDLIIDTKVCCNNEGYQTVAFNPVDRHIYHACMRVTDYTGEEEYDSVDELIFEKLNPDTLEVTVIETSGLNYVRGVEFSTSSYINDGGNDMYDDGNFLSTNRQDNGFIEYTHTQQESEGGDYEFTQIADGTVEDGTDWFGSGSTYFTNMYEGLFVMVAKDIDITEFTISGNLGADGSGFVAQETITLNNGHTGYFKKVYGADDPSVNHLIIIPSKNGVFSNISGDTNEDYHSLTNLSGVDYIYYLLFSTTEDNNYEITTEEATIIGNSFLSTINGSNMSASSILTRLNLGHANITQNIPDIYFFTDYAGEEDIEFIGYKPGLDEPHCMTYQAGNKFLIASDGGLFSITTDGFISLVGTQFYWADCRGLAFVGNRLFASFTSIDQIAEINPYTGEILNQNQDKKGPAVIVDAGENQINTSGIRALAGNDDGLFISSYDGNETHTIAFISNLEPDENNILYATSITDMRFTGGLTIEKFGKTPPPGNWFWGYNEESTGIRVPAYENEEPIELNANELQVQWHEDDNANQSYTGWQDIDVQEVIESNEGSDFIVVIDKPVGNFKVRMRFNNPVSKWNYYEWD